MPLFEQCDGKLTLVQQTNFDREKELQSLIEGNLETAFSCRFVATEFSTGELHGGRIDTIGLSEDGNPVIIEYKKSESSDLILQSLYYLDWIRGHRGDFERAVRKSLGHEAKVDWSDIRVICLAPNYKKYALHAVQQMSTKVELWRHRLFGNNVLYIEEISRSPGKDSDRTDRRKTLQERSTLEDHLADKPEHIKQFFNSLRDYSLSLDDKVEEAIKKRYIAYKAAKNFASFQIQKIQIHAFLKLDPEDFEGGEGVRYIDVTDTGHYGTGNSRITIESDEDVEAIKPFIELSFQRVGGA